MEKKPPNSPQKAPIYLLMLLTGLVYAWWLDNTRWGRFIVEKRTWLSVVIGNAIVLAGASLLTPLSHVREIVQIMAITAVGVVLRSLRNEAILEAQIEDYLREQ